MLAFGSPSQKEKGPSYTDILFHTVDSGWPLCRTATKQLLSGKQGGKSRKKKRQDPESLSRCSAIRQGYKL